MLATSVSHCYTGRTVTAGTFARLGPSSQLAQRDLSRVSAMRRTASPRATRAVRYRAAGDRLGGRSPPTNWKQTVIRLAEERVWHYRKLIEKLRYRD
jgi:hypothetical protein